MKKTTYLLAVSSAVIMSGCSNNMKYAPPSLSTSSSPQTRYTTHYRYKASTPEKEAKFHQVMTAVAQSTKLDPNYQKLSLSKPEEKAWFKKLMYHLWDRQITRAQFIEEGVAKYPGHKYEFTYIANAYQKY